MYNTKGGPCLAFVLCTKCVTPGVGLVWRSILWAKCGKLDLGLVWLLFFGPNVLRQMWAMFGDSSYGPNAANWIRALSGFCSLGQMCCARCGPCLATHHMGQMRHAILGPYVAFLRFFVAGQMPKLPELPKDKRTWAKLGKNVCATWVRRRKDAKSTLNRDEALEYEYLKESHDMKNNSPKRTLKPRISYHIGLTEAKNKADSARNGVSYVQHS